MENESYQKYMTMLKKGEDELKVSWIKFKFSEDPLSAVRYFTDAAKGFLKLKRYNESIKCFLSAIDCNKKLRESWPEAQNWIQLAKIYLSVNKDTDKCLNSLQNALNSFMYINKVDTAIRAYLDISNTAKSGGLNEFSIQVMSEIFEVCIKYSHEPLIRVSLDSVYSSYIDSLCLMEKYKEAITVTNKIIDLQKLTKNEAKNKITKNMTKLIMLHLIIEEDYICDQIANGMFEVFDKSCGDDIEDARNLIKSFKTIDKKSFDDLIQYSFELYDTNLLKKLRRKFEDKNLQNIDCPIDEPEAKQIDVEEKDTNDEWL